jgi:hypothetical protein
MTLKKGDTAKRQCINPKCLIFFKPKQAIQKFCSPKCRIRVQHLRHIEKYPEQRRKFLDKLLEYIKTKPNRRRIKKRILPKQKYPSWLVGV